MLDFETICRVCMRSDHELLPIFDEPVAEQSIGLAAMIAACSIYEVSQADGLPRRICNSCLEALRHAYHFKQNCENSYRHLMNIISNSKHVERVNETKRNYDDGETPRNVVEPIHTVFINESAKQNRIYHLESAEKDTAAYDTKEKMPHNKDPICNSKSGRHDSPSSVANSVKSVKSKTTKEKPYCDQCKINFVNEVQYKKHCNTKHKEKSFTCSECNKSFNRKSSLERHASVHDRNQYTCRDCSQFFNTKYELDEHKKSKEHDKPLLCPECGLRCKWRSSLVAHMRLHTGEKPYKCRFCNKGFPRSDNLKQHEKYHKDERSHFCETCGKGFYRKTSLTVHLRVHTGERPYKCPHCQQSFSHSHYLKLHIRLHTGERLSCEICNATFLQGYQLRNHKFAQHGIKEEPPTQRLSKVTPAEQENRIGKQVNL